MTPTVNQCIRLRTDRTRSRTIRSAALANGGLRRSARLRCRRPTPCAGGAKRHRQGGRHLMKRRGTREDVVAITLAAEVAPCAAGAEELKLGMAPDRLPGTLRWPGEGRPADRHRRNQRRGGHRRPAHDRDHREGHPLRSGTDLDRCAGADRRRGLGVDRALRCRSGLRGGGTGGRGQGAGVLHLRQLAHPTPDGQRLHVRQLPGATTCRPPSPPTSR
jgi:hypothetical protein